MDLKELIARQRVAIENPPSKTVRVALGGEIVAVTVTKLHPTDWQHLVAAHPPRMRTLAGVDSSADKPQSVMVDSDSTVGYDQHGLPAAYPVDRLAVAGQPVDAETWDAIFDVLDSVHKNVVGIVMWDLNVGDSLAEVQRLGKVAADQQSASPENRASRRAASKGGNPRRSPRTSTTTPSIPSD